MRIDDIIIEHHQHGQARRYADSVYEAYISVRIVGDLIGTAVHYLNLKRRRSRTSRATGCDRLRTNRPVPLPQL